MDAVRIVGVEGMPIVRKGDNVALLIVEAARKHGYPLQSGDIIVVTHAIISSAEGRIVNLDEVEVSEFARAVAAELDKDAALVEVVLRESKGIRRMGDGKLITESKHGFVCANSGVDKSNVEGERNVALLPADPDASARQIKAEVKRLTGCDVAIIVSDTHGRPLREGEINVAIGVAGFLPIMDRRGEKDLFGYVLRVKQTAVADELASAAELVIGQADEGIPAAIIRGYNYVASEHVSAKSLSRSREKDLFL